MAPGWLPWQRGLATAQQLPRCCVGLCRVVTRAKPGLGRVLQVTDPSWVACVPSPLILCPRRSPVSFLQGDRMREVNELVTGLLIAAWLWAGGWGVRAAVGGGRSGARLKINPRGRPLPPFRLHLPLVPWALTILLTLPCPFAESFRFSHLLSQALSLASKPSC